MRWFESSRPCHFPLLYFIRIPSVDTGTCSVSKMMVFTGNANLDLARRVVRQLHIPLGDVSVGKFSDGEISVEINENVRGKDVFLIQPTCAPTNDNLMELVVMADAFRRSSATRITAVIPYFGYARQDRRPRSARVAISAKVVADMLTVVGVNRVLTVDLHADQIQGFFDIPVDNIYGSPVLVDDIEDQRFENLMIVSRTSAAWRARAVAKSLGVDLAIIDKRRPKANQSEVMHIIGDVEGRTCVLVDDMVDTAGTLGHAAKASERARRRQGHRLLHPPGAVRPCHREHREIRTGRAGGDQHHPAVRRCPGLWPHPPAGHRSGRCGSHAPDQQRRIDQRDVPLRPSLGERA